MIFFYLKIFPKGDFLGPTAHESHLYNLRPLGHPHRQHSSKLCLERIFAFGKNKPPPMVVYAGGNIKIITAGSTRRVTFRSTDGRVDARRTNNICFFNEKNPVL